MASNCNKKKPMAHKSVETRCAVPPRVVRVGWWVTPRVARLTHPTVDMWKTCNHAWRMSAMIQIRNVPDPLHRRLKARAALAGMSLSDFLLREIQLVAERPTLEELRARLEKRAPVSLSESPAHAVRAERERR